MHVNNIAAGARSWFPCVDKPHVKCPWILEITIPRTVAKALDLTERACAQEMIAIASGDLVDHIVHPKDPFKKVFVYSLKTPVAAGSILLAVGPFECLDIPGWGVSSQTDALVPDSEETENQQLEGRLFGGGRTFYLPGRREQVQHSTGFLHHVRMSLFHCCEYYG